VVLVEPDPDHVVADRLDCDDRGILPTRDDLPLARRMIKLSISAEM
jgi:hypothetical protein